MPGQSEIVDRVIADVGGAFATGLAYIGDRLGLFRELAALGSCSSPQLAQRVRLDERYVREWLKAMVSAGYLEAEGDQYFMTTEQEQVLANEASPVFAAGAFQFALPSLTLTTLLMDCFRDGGGISYEALGPEIPKAIDRMHRPWFEHQLCQKWLAGVPGLVERLNRGMRVLDVGCGLGRSTVALKRAWPASEVTGLDPDRASLDEARALAARAQVEVRFREARLSDLSMADAFDLILAIDCIHDMADPVSELAELRRLLSADGILFWSEPTGSSSPMENRSPVEKMRSCLSPYHCLTVSLAEGGLGLGTIIGEDGARRLAVQAGFDNFERVAIESRMQQFFVLKKPVRAQG